MKRTKQATEGPIVMACDPSLTGWGYVLLCGNKVIKAECIKTVPEQKKRRIRKGDDNVRRIGEIIHVLRAEIEENNVTYLITELPHGSQNAAGAMMIGAVIGIMETLARCYAIGVEWYSENDAKKAAAAGRKITTKADMIEVMDSKFIVDWPNAKYKKEAIADALAIYNCALQESSTLKYLTKW